VEDGRRLDAPDASVRPGRVIGRCASDCRWTDPLMVIPLDRLILVPCTVVRSLP
jgi:hypothetical protein